MSRYPGVAALIEAGGRRSTRQDLADRIATKATQVQDAQEALADNDIVPKTLLPPSPPTGVFIKPRNRGMDITWDAPPATDYVAMTEVRLVRVSDNVTTIHKFEGKLLGGSINGLNPVDYDVSLQHRNKFGAVSGFTQPATRITPSPTIAEQIAADIQIAATQITGELGQAQIPQITSPEKLAQAVYEAAASAAGKGANLLPYEESNWELYNAGAWPQRGESAVAGDNRTLNIVASPFGKLEMNVVASSTALVGSPSCFFNSWARRSTVSGESYIASMVVRNASGASGRAQIVVQAASDSVGTGATVLASSGPVTIPSDGKDYRVFCKFTASANLPFLRLLEYALDAGNNLLYRDFQLEKAEPRQTTPSIWKLPAVSVGALSAKLIAAWDLTAVRAIIGNATIESAKVVSLAAEKFVGGTITGQEFILAVGGRFRTANNGTRIDDGGITLAHGADFNSRAFRLDQKISSLAENAAVAFYHDTTTGYRGLIIRSDGNNTDGARGSINLHATYAGVLGASTSARVEVLAASAGGVVNVYGTLAARDDLRLLNTLIRQQNPSGVIQEVNNTAIAASTGVLTLTHGLGAIPFMPFFEWLDTATSVWRPMADNVSSWRIDVTNTTVVIRNLASTPTSRSVRGVIFK